MAIKLKDYLFDSGSALVLNGEKDLLDADFAQLGDFSEKQRSAITTVVLSNTDVKGQCFQYLALLPNLKALYAFKTRINDDALVECLPKTVEILNLNHTEIGDVCVFKLGILPDLHTVWLQETGVTNRGINVLATMTSLRECYFGGTAVSEYAMRRLNNAIDLHAASFYKNIHWFLNTIGIGARKIILHVWDAKSAWYLRFAITRWLRPSL